MIMAWRKDVSELNFWCSMFISTFFTCINTDEKGQPWCEAKSVVKKVMSKIQLSVTRFVL